MYARIEKGKIREDELNSKLSQLIADNEALSESFHRKTDTEINLKLKSLEEEVRNYQNEIEQLRADSPSDESKNMSNVGFQNEIKELNQSHQLELELQKARIYKSFESRESELSGEISSLKEQIIELKKLETNESFEMKLRREEMLAGIKKCYESEILELKDQIGTLSLEISKRDQQIHSLKETEKDKSNRNHYDKTADQKKLEEEIIRLNELIKTHVITILNSNELSDEPLSKEQESEQQIVNVLQLNDLQEKISYLESELISKDETIDSQSKELVELSSKIEGLKKKFALEYKSLQTIHSEKIIEVQIEESKKAEELQQHHKETIQSLELKIDELKDSNQSFKILEQTLADKTETIQTLNQQIIQLKSLKDTIEESCKKSFEFEKLNLELENNKKIAKINDEFQARVTKMEHDFRICGEELKKSRDICSHLQNQIQSVESNKQLINTRLIDESKTSESLNRQLEHLSQNFTAQRLAFETLQTEYNKAQMIIKSQKDQLTLIKSKCEMECRNIIEELNERQQNDLMKVQNMYSEKEKVCDDLQIELTKARHKIQHIEQAQKEMVKDLKNDIQSKNEILKEYNKTMEKLKADNRQKINSIEIKLGEKHRQKYESKIEKLRGENENIENKLVEAMNIIEDLNKKSVETSLTENKELNEKMKTLRKTHEEKVEQLRIATKATIDSLNEKLKSLTESNERYKDKIDEMESKFRDEKKSADLEIWKLTEAHKYEIKKLTLKSTAQSENISKSEKEFQHEIINLKNQIDELKRKHKDELKRLETMVNNELKSAHDGYIKQFERKLEQEKRKIEKNGQRKYSDEINNVGSVNNSQRSERRMR